MSEEREVSFEELNAFIDGELDAGASARVLAAIDVDDQLKRQACELRALRDQVRHAYEPARLGSVKARARFSGGRWPQALAAGLLLVVGAAVGWQGHAWQRSDEASGVWQRLSQVKAHGDARRLVLHVGDPDSARFENTLDEVRGMLKAAHDRGQRMELEILANGTGLNLLRVKTTPFADRLAQLQAEFPELSLVACGQGLNRLQGQGDDIRLVPGVVTADSALDEIVRRMNQGWAYLRV
jgi:intracellular sulfur oxidation DsrE/DsrF family protein